MPVQETTTTLPLSVLTPETRAAILQASKDYVLANADAEAKFNDKVKLISTTREIDAGQAIDLARVDHPDLFAPFQVRAYAVKLRAILMSPSLDESAKITIPNVFLTSAIQKDVSDQLDGIEAAHEQAGTEPHLHHRQARERLAKLKGVTK